MKPAAEAVAAQSIGAIPYEREVAGTLVDPGILRDALAERLGIAKTNEGGNSRDSAAASLCSASPSKSQEAQAEDLQ